MYYRLKHHGLDNLFKFLWKNEKATQNIKFWSKTCPNSAENDASRWKLRALAATIILYMCATVQQLSQSVNSRMIPEFFDLSVADTETLGIITIGTRAIVSLLSNLCQPK